MPINIPSRLSRRRHTLWAALVLSLAIVASGALPAAAAGDASDITWAVSPASESGPDSRGVIEQELDPGDSRTDYFAVRNRSAYPVTFALSAADGYHTPAGRFNMFGSDKKSVDAGTWISMPDTVAVDANGTQVVKFTTTVPKDALPGDHAAGIAASILSVGADSTGTQLRVESRVGFRVMTRVTGEFTASAGLTLVSADYSLSWNPLRAGSMLVTFEVVNNGNTRLLAKGDARAGFGSADFPRASDPRQELLPGEKRIMTATVHGVWPLFVVPTAVELASTAISYNGDPIPVDTVVDETIIWAVPLPQLVWLVGIALLIWVALWGRSASRRRTQAMLDEARERGRQEAASDVDPVILRPDEQFEDSDAGAMETK